MRYKVVIAGGETIGEAIRRELIEKELELTDMHRVIGEQRMSELLTAVSSGEVYRLHKDYSDRLQENIVYAIELAEQCKSLRIMRGLNV